MIDIMAEPTLIKDILPQVFTGLIERYEQANDPDLRSDFARDPWAGRSIIEDLRGQIRRQGIRK